jgi:outer membrane lipoprotein-sorting protein
MRWEYESPEDKLFIADGKTVWFYVPADHTVTRRRMKESTDWRTPLALLTGPPRRAKLARVCGRIELAGERPAAAGHVVLRCLPRGEAAREQPKEPADALGPGDEGEPFREVLLEVDTTRNELARVLIRQSGDTEIEYRFGDWQQNLPLAEAMFRFQAPVGAAIVDESALRGPK